MRFELEQFRPFVALAVDRRVDLSRSQRRTWLRDSNLRDTVAVLAEARYAKAEDGFGVKEDEDEESGLLRFLQWLIDHQDEIKALIEMIMSLFNTEEKNVV